MAGKNVKVLEGEIGQLKSDLEKKISDFQNQISSNNERMEGKFVVMEEILKKLLELKTNPTTSEARETIGGHGRGGNPNMSSERENPEIEILEGEDDMPPLEPLSKEERSTGFERRVADFSGKMEDFDHRGSYFDACKVAVQLPSAGCLRFGPLLLSVWAFGASRKWSKSLDLWLLDFPSNSSPYIFLFPLPPAGCSPPLAFPVLSVRFLCFPVNGLSFPVLSCGLFPLLAVVPVPWLISFVGCRFLCCPVAYFLCWLSFPALSRGLFLCFCVMFVVTYGLLFPLT
ncbi:hypothetical protein M5K25_006126 [Dendrobium thyrsiflorum]|uniref:Uncharacterized protein n=1 Tax=Dendrobium thyrsiflorum TaxID=117978 RepID=A0ABD0VHL7_DENTH